MIPQMTLVRPHLRRTPVKAKSKTLTVLEAIGYGIMAMAYIAAAVAASYEAQRLRNTVNLQADEWLPN